MILFQNSLEDLNLQLSKLEVALTKAKEEKVTSDFDQKEKDELINFFTGKKAVVELRIKKLGL